MNNSSITICRRCLAAVSLLFPVLALAGCNGREGDSRRIIPVSLNADGIVYCIQAAQRNAQQEMRLENVTVAAFREPDTVRITGTRKDGQGRGVLESYAIAFSVQNHITRAHVTAEGARGTDSNSALVQQFSEALSRAFTTYALKDNSDGGIRAVHVEGKLLILDVEAPLR